VLANRAISHGHAGDRLAHRAATGTLPPGTASAQVTLVLATSPTNDDGADAPIVGYDRAVADGLRFSVSAPVRRPPPLTPPPVHVPRYQHVFLFYFENEDFGSVLGNTAQAPFLNRLVPQSSLLASFYAEAHPSDANYLALAGGSAFGVPLTDPLEENSQYTIRARNIGDLIGAQHETWKAYLQSANGPCDDTVHRYYWNDDEPMTYFADVRDRPAYCAAHLVPLPALRTDLASAATTPNFVWIAPDDCADMEGCGIAAGDKFLATELGAIMRSPAWRTQRSLAIITFDEDGYDHEHPAQRVLTLMLGSAGVRPGYVSHTRYTHYSLLRTIEGALGLGTLTRNDLYAQPVNDVFSHGPAAPASSGASAAAPGVGAAGQGPPGPLALPAAGAPAAAGARAAVTGARTTAMAGPSAAGAQPTAFVVNSGGTVTPISLATRRAGPPIAVGANPEAIAITPDGRTAYVANYGSNSVTPIDTATRQAGPPIAVGANPEAIAVTPDGRTAYVADDGSNSVTPDRHRHRAGGPADQGRREPAGGRHHPRWADRLRARLGRRRGDADQHRHQPGGPADPGRQLPIRDRHRARRQDRLRRQLRLEQPHPDQRPHRPGRPSRSGWPGARCGRRHARQREGVRGRRRLRHPDPRQRHHRARGSRRAGGVRAGGGRHLPVGRDGLRGQHGLRHRDAGQHHDRPGGRADPGRHLHLPDGHRAHRHHRGGGRHLRGPGHAGQHRHPEGDDPDHGRHLPGRRRHRGLTGPAAPTWSR
jgi:YVTN family beta-propeller protein